MDWNSRRITAILENALVEDRATRDATSYACIDPNQRASATIVSKQDCILAGIGCVARILDVYAATEPLPPTTRSLPIPKFSMASACIRDNPSR
jgi:nicotinate-nucleotide pyrophosphorylase